MLLYYVNIKELVLSNKHDMHIKSCSHFPSSYLEVGEFKDCATALAEARVNFPKWNIVACSRCCTECSETKFK